MTMFGDENLNNLVANVINGTRYSHCRLCLKKLQKYVRLSDVVAINRDTPSFQLLSEVLSNILGEEMDEIPGIEAVCLDCTDKALQTMRFLDTCNYSTRNLNIMFDSLTQSLDVEVDEKPNNAGIFVVISKDETKTLLVYNEKSEDDPLQNFECVECNEEFVNLDDFKEHNLVHHEAENVCEDCFQAFHNIKHLNAHLCAAKQETCSICGYRNTKEKLKEHEDKIHMIHICKDCGKKCKGLNKLHSHEKKHKSRSVCPKCGKTYNTKEFFMKHTKLCLEDKLDPHPTRSNIEKPYSCKECGKCYSTPGGLRVHNRFVHGDAKPHVCQYCNKAFTAPSYLKVHMIKHTGEKKFKCNKCSKNFVSREALLYHTRRHTGEKPYGCKICDEKFVNASARAEHVKFKHVGPTYMCEVCSRKYYTLSFLRQHVAKHNDPTSKLYIGRSLLPPNMPSKEIMRNIDTSPNNNVL